MIRVKDILRLFAVVAMLLIGLNACRTLDTDDVMCDASLKLRFPDAGEGVFNLEIQFTNINTKEVIKKSNVRQLEVQQRLLKGVYRIQANGNFVPLGHPSGALPLVVRGHLDAVILTGQQDPIIVPLISLQK
ncbi:hypothetical protein [Porphyromonas sp.]|uniref:hypothetical protein n=1 Tax=Porphyromonas sp. TaxID=1924944 RepID=UPI0026DC462E|nr:hypothetical protein [Porphyromonas sp.]MDO4695865.1 hypothetical protein [Porphyromonas sp.]MDO4771503.1 hypothetical protein [Porphyromonas sp.]